MGTPLFAAQVLENCIKSGVSFSGIVTSPDKPQGRGYNLKKTPVKEIAEKHDIPCYQPNNKEQLCQLLRIEKPELSIVVAYGMIFPDNIVDEYLLINLHASLLPSYRGSSPIQSAILNGDKIMGVTLICIDHQVDSGDIIDQEQFTVEDKDNLESISTKMIRQGAALISKQLLLPLDNWSFKPQKHEQATFTKKIKKQDGEIDFKIDTPELIIKKIKAFYPWPGVYCFKNNKRIKICEATLENGQIIINKVQVEGKRPVSYQSYCAGNTPLIY